MWRHIEPGAILRISKCGGGAMWRLTGTDDIGTAEKLASTEFSGNLRDVLTHSPVETVEL